MADDTPMATHRRTTRLRWRGSTGLGDAYGRQHEVAAPRPRNAGAHNRV